MTCERIHQEVTACHWHRYVSHGRPDCPGPNQQRRKGATLKMHRLMRHVEVCLAIRPADSKTALSEPWVNVHLQVVRIGISNHSVDSCILQLDRKLHWL